MNRTLTSTKRGVLEFKSINQSIKHLSNQLINYKLKRIITEWIMKELTNKLRNTSWINQKLWQGFISTNSLKNNYKKNLPLIRHLQYFPCYFFFYLQFSFHLSFSFLQAPHFRQSIVVLSQRYLVSHIFDPNCKFFRMRASLRNFKWPF